MIFIERTRPVPDALLRYAESATNLFCLLYDAAKADYDAGRKVFDFDAQIYGHQTVKESLRLMQHGKCAFCESKIGHVQYGDVEHFRPKAGYRQRPEDKFFPSGRPHLAGRGTLSPG